MKSTVKLRSKLRAKAARGFRGYPVATVAYYGPDNSKATKVAVGIVLSDDADPEALMRWYAKDIDARYDVDITGQILEFIREYRAVSVAYVDSILGCPHEEGIDYPLHTYCPLCPYWKGKDGFDAIIKREGE